MSFSNLKRKSLSASRELVTVDGFIQQAEYYARGEQANVVTLRQAESHTVSEDKKLKPCTYTLSAQARLQLTDLALETGMSRSRLLRVLLCDMQKAQVLALAKNTRVK